MTQVVGGCSYSHEKFILRCVWLYCIHVSVRVVQIFNFHSKTFHICVCVCVWACTFLIQLTTHPLMIMNSIFSAERIVCPGGLSMRDHTFHRTGRAELVNSDLTYTRSPSIIHHTGALFQRQGPAEKREKGLLGENWIPFTRCLKQQSWNFNQALKSPRWAAPTHLTHSLCLSHTQTHTHFFTYFLVTNTFQ